MFYTTQAPIAIYHDPADMLANYDRLTDNEARSREQGEWTREAVKR